MKLQDLAVANPTKQASKVFESYFGNSVSFDSVTREQALGMLRRVRAVIAEHRRTPEFHRSEQNPTYLKLVVMEQALAATAVAPATTGQTPQQTVAMKSAEMAKAKKQRDDRRKEIDQQMADLNKEKAELNKPMPTMENYSLRRRLKESEVQQAQVVLASQDMVDQVQKMSEQISAMQFKDLPALCDSIKNEVGVDQATQFNADATAALSGLLQNLQGAKQQLEVALGVVTGQAPQVPGADIAGGVAGEIPAELPASDEAPMDLDLDIDLDAEEEPAVAGLGRERR